MFSAKEMSLVFETLLSSPGMNDTVKVNLTLSRKNLLLLSKVIEQGLRCKESDGTTSVLQALDDSAFEEIGAVSNELLQKGGLTVMNEKLESFSGARKSKEE